MNSLGIDSSSGDGVIDWAITASRGVEFATIRATWGVAYIDQRYTINMAGAHQNFIKRVGYHWFVPRLDAIAQARWLASHSVPAELPRMVDLEDTATVKAYYGIGAEILKYLQEIKRLTGEVCWIYTSPSYISSYLYNCYWLNEYPIVIAHWDAAAPRFVKPLETGRWTAWQFTGNAYAPYYGISQCQEAALYIYNGQV